MKPTRPRPDRDRSPAVGEAGWSRAENLLNSIVEGTSAVTGKDFFRSLVQHLARGLIVRWVFIAECLPEMRARSLAYWDTEDFGADFEYDLRGSPCLKVAQGRVCHVPDRLPELFLEDKAMIDMGTKIYLGVPIRDSERRIIGHLVIFDDKPIPHEALALSVMEIFASRAGVELERTRAFDDLHRQKHENWSLPFVPRHRSTPLTRNSRDSRSPVSIHSA